MMLKERLLEERDAILRGLHLKKAEGEISTHGDLVDQSTNFSEQEVILGLAEHDRNRLQDINRALNKIEDGTYGICEMSGKLISDERLVAIPTARYSVECQAKVEGFG
ncbi:MAG: TraR/DksA C4-type zinc finger protein [Candidatus Omnitrophica bacterium]|nr:TraR/DksA C4-type zinc finger protein [Candidatus Omnitrophota bacterium]